MFRSKIRMLAAALILPFCVCVAGMGQATSGSVSGTVHDPSGAVVPGATVTISDVAKGTKSVTRTDSVGSYAFPSLMPGTYTISVEMTGFKRSVQANFPLDIDQKADLDITLQTGGTSETVEVTAAPPLIKLESSELGDVVSQHQVQDLPLNGRNFAQLVYLVPGVTAGQAGENLSGSSSFNPRAASDFNSLGSQANTNQWLVDGIIDNEWTFNTVMVQPSVESVAEFKVMTGTYSAEYGGGAGIISTSTRSGGNALHGEVFTYLRNSALDARNYFARVGSAVQKPAYRRGQFGGAVGGAIKKDKLFYFADYYGQRSLKGIVNTNSVPTLAERTGDFSNYTNSHGLIPIYDPLTTVQTGNTFTRTQFSCNGVLNVICPARLSQVGLNLASIYPLPQTSGSFNNYISTANQIINDNGGNARIDYHLSDKDSMFGRWSYERFVQGAPNPLVGGQGTCCLPPSATAAKNFDLGPFVAGIQNTTLVAQGLSIEETHFFSSNTYNAYRMGYARTNPFTTQSDFGHNSSTSLGIAGLNVSPYTTGLPNITVGGSCGTEFTCLQGGTAFLPANPRQTNVQFEDTFSQTRGRHGLKAGFRYVRVYSSPFTNTTTRGAMTFNDNFTNYGSIQDPVYVQQKQDTYGSGLAGILLGFPNSGSRNFLIVPYYDLNVQYGMFFQDDWKISQRLTLNLGIREDIYTPDTDKNNKLANFDFTKMAFVFAGQNGTSRSAGIQQRNNDFQPRVGLAFDLDGKGTTVVRAGFGISYFEDPFSASDELGQNPPFTISQTFASPATFPLPGSFGNLCSPTNVTSTCQPVITNPFPQGVVPLSYATLTNTALLNAAQPAIVSHSMANKTPSTQTYTLGIERQVLGGVVELAYGGSHSVHLTFLYNPNEVGLIQPGGPTSTTLRRLIQPLNNISTWAQEDPINRSNYNSLQVKYTKRYSHGLMALIDYTYGKSLDYGGSAASGGGSAGNPQTITNLKAGYGVSGFDQKHRLVSSVNYDLPFGGNQKFLNSGVISHIVGGFEVDAITTYGSGAPFTVTLNSGVNSGSPSWPNRIGKGKIDHGTPQRFFDTTAFVAPPANTYGNSARSVLYGPSTKNWDMSLQRKIKLHEDMTLSIRLDAFNAFNTKNLATPVSAIGASTAGQITGTINDNRDLQGSVTLHF